MMLVVTIIREPETLTKIYDVVTNYNHVYNEVIKLLILKLQITLSMQGIEQKQDIHIQVNTRNGYFTLDRGPSLRDSTIYSYDEFYLGVN